MQRFFYISLLFVSISTTAFAQSNATASTSTTLEFIETTSNDWLFFNDMDNQLLYIDLETFEGKLTDIRLKNESDEVVLTEDLLNTPIDTILEINLKEYKSGSYKLELRTFKEVIQKEITVD